MLLSSHVPFSFLPCLHTSIGSLEKTFIATIVISGYNSLACHEFSPVAQTMVLEEDTQQKTYIA